MDDDAPPVIGAGALLSGPDVPLDNQDDLVWSDEEVENGQGDVEMEEGPPVRPEKPAHELERLNSGHIVPISILGTYEFHVLTKENEKKFRDMEKSIKTYCSDRRMVCAEEDLKEERYVLVFSTTFKRWCRAQLVALIKSKNHDLSTDLFCDNLSTEFVKVHLIDYRYNEDEIPVKYVCNGDIFFNFETWPVRSIKCALAGFKPQPGKTFEATQLMKTLVLGKQVWFLFQTIKNDQAYIAISYPLRAVAVEHLGLRESLITAGFGSFDASTDFFRINYKFGRSYFEPQAPKVNDVFTGIVSHVDSPDEFFIHRASERDVIHDLQQEINDFVGNKNNSEEFRLFHLIKGMACLARFHEDGLVYRAIIEGDVDYLRKKCLVRYVDYGNRGEVNFPDFFLLPDNFRQKPKMCFECKLGGVEPAGYNWTQNAISRFRQLTGCTAGSDDYQHLAVRVQYKEKGCTDRKLHVSLQRWEPGPGPEVDIGKELVKINVAHFTADHGRDRSLMDLMNEQISSVAILRDICQRHETAQSSLKERLIPIWVTCAPSLDEIWVRNEIPSVKVVYKLFFEELQKKMNLAATVKQEDEDLEPGRLCAFQVPAAEGKSWVRGKVIQKDQQKDGEDFYKIMAIDVGSTYLVPKKKVFDLPSQFVSHDPYVVKCALYGIKSATGNGWTATGYNKFVEFLSDPRWKESLHLIVKEKILGTDPNQVIKCNIIGEEKKIQLFDTVTVYHSLCDMMIETYGVALPLDRSDYVTDREILNDKALVHSTEVSHRGVRDLQLNRDSLYSRIVQATSSNEEVSYYPQPILPSKNQFEGQVTNIDESFNICFRLTENNPITIAINRDISSQMVNGSLSPFNPPHDKGRACTARFSQDKTWNRAKFLDFCSGNIVKVYFVDYGNTDQLFLENLSQKVFAPDTPELAIKSQLHGVKASDEKVREVLYQQMYDMMVDKICSFTWENFPNVPMKVSVIDKQTGLDIKRELMQKNLLTETVDANDISPNVVTALSVLPRSSYSDLLFDQLSKDNNCIIPVCFSSKFGHDLIYLQLRGIDNPVDEQNVYLKACTDRYLIMSDLIQDFSRGVQPIGKALVGDSCLAPFDDGRYYRGLIIKEDVGFDEDVLVYFVDYGNIYNVPLPK